MNFTISIFGDFAKFRYGKMPKKSSIKENGKYPIYSGYRYVGYCDEYNTEANQLIIVARGVGGTGDVKLTREKCYLTNLSISAEIDSNVAIPQYLYYYFSMRNLRYLDSGSAQSQITISDLEKVRIPLPNIESQKKIVHCLSLTDNKISANESINNNLEQQAQAIFKSWFVDFELNYGIMPSDWKVSQLGSIVKISTEVFSPAKNPNVKVEHYSIPAYDEKRYPVFETSNGIKSNKYRLSSNSVMISKLNPDTKRIWRPYCISVNPICSTEFIVYEPINPLNRDFIYSIIDSIGFSAFLCSHTTGSTNSRQRATPSITLTYDIIVPDEKTIQAFCSIVSPMYDTIENNIKENQKLAETRDKLLPKLMSGKLDVSGIDL